MSQDGVVLTTVAAPHDEHLLTRRAAVGGQNRSQTLKILVPIEVLLIIRHSTRSKSTITNSNSILTIVIVLLTLHIGRSNTPWFQMLVLRQSFCFSLCVTMPRYEGDNPNSRKDKSVLPGCRRTRLTQVLSLVIQSHNMSYHLPINTLPAKNEIVLSGHECSAISL